MKKIFIIMIIAILLSIILVHSIVTVEIHHIFKCSDPSCRACMELQMIQKISELFNHVIIKYYLIYNFLAILFIILEIIFDLKKYCLVDLNVRLNE